METVIVTFDEENADVEVATTGFSGSACLKATAWLEKALGKVTGNSKTSEFYKAPIQAKAQNRERS